MPSEPHAPESPNAATRVQLVTLPGHVVSITETAERLYTLIAPRHELFVRGKAVVSLCRSMTGQLVLEPVKPSAARSLFEKYARFIAWRSGRAGHQVLKPTVMPEETARAILECHAATAILPAVNGLVNCPVMVEAGDGLRVCGKGYSAETGLLITRGEAPADVPLPEAVESLKKVLAHFQFQSPSDHARAIAALITPALKMGNLIHGHVPVDVAEADQSQSGKSLRQKMTAAIYGETLALVPLKRAGVGGTDESLYEKLVNGRPFIQLDNFRGRLDSPALEALLTANGSFPCRIPYFREIEVDPSRFFILMTSNGVETTRDLANRSSIIRICKRENVAFPDTLGDITDRYPYHLACVFAVVREWHRQGKPRTGEKRHDFPAWSQPLDWIVQNIFGMAPLMDGHRGAQERVSNPTLTLLRRIGLEVERAARLGEALTASEIVELANAADLEIPGMRREDAHDEEKARKVIGMRLGPLFKAAPTVELDGLTITRGEAERPRTDGGHFKAKTYTFARLPQPPQPPQ